MTINKRLSCRVIAWLIAAAILAVPLPLFAQGTNINAPDNKYSISDDIKLGREAAAEVERRMPILPEGGDVDDYVERVGQRLVNGIPREFSIRSLIMNLMSSTRGTSTLSLCRAGLCMSIVARLKRRRAKASWQA